MGISTKKARKLRATVKADKQRELAIAAMAEIDSAWQEDVRKELGERYGIPEHLVDTWLTTVRTYPLPCTVEEVLLTPVRIRDNLLELDKQKESMLE